MLVSSRAKVLSFLLSIFILVVILFLPEPGVIDASAS